LAIAAATYARAQGLAQDGYRIVMNCREHAGQTVFHLHLHLLAGAPLRWPACQPAAPAPAAHRPGSERHAAWE
ncbi:HIT domain-containing protein, partial [Xanthomonas perforans]|uniref:HIT domain-containing protein n=1 Tax=Xanthomonas perforans TaxID=442694 RepID=UPI001F1C3391